MIHVSCVLHDPDAGDDARIQWAVSWVASHIEASARLGKPLCLQEFGKKPAGGSRTELFKQVMCYGL